VRARAPALEHPAKVLGRVGAGMSDSKALGSGRSAKLALVGQSRSRLEVAVNAQWPDALSRHRRWDVRLGPAVRGSWHGLPTRWPRCQRGVQS
jgi:hypothetical protein